MKHWFIYALSDPRTGETRYIGKTTSLEWRLSEHIQDAVDNVCTMKARWLRGLLQCGSWPEIRVLDDGHDNRWPEAEKYYIRFFREEVGSRLLNMTDGGEGCPGHKHSPESRAKMGVRKGSRLTETTRAKIREARAKQVMPPLSADARRRISESNKGRPRPDNVARNKSRSGWHFTEEQKRRFSEMRKGTDTFAKYRERLTPEERTSRARHAASVRWGR